MSSQTRQSGEQAIRVVVVGAGSMGSSHARAYAELDAHTRTNALLVHRVAEDGGEAPADELIDMSDEPDHQELCTREQRLFLEAIRGGSDLAEHLADAVNSLRIVLAADESVRTGKIVGL